MARALVGSRMDEVKLYGAKPTNPTRTPSFRTTATWPGRPSCAMWAAVNACSVCCCPAYPKSYEWLFALFKTVKPARRRSNAYDGGFRNAKQSRGGEGDFDELDGVGVSHFDEVALVSVPSR